MAQKKTSAPIAPDTRKGDPRYEAILRQWEYEKRPGQIIVGNISYLPLQDPETSEWYFRPINAESQYSTRSF